MTRRFATVAAILCVVCPGRTRQRSTRSGPSVQDVQRGVRERRVVRADGERVAERRRQLSRRQQARRRRQQQLQRRRAQLIGQTLGAGEHVQQERAARLLRRERVERGSNVGVKGVCLFEDSGVVGGDERDARDFVEAR